jgi:hypothetical protein
MTIPGWEGARNCDTCVCDDDHSATIRQKVASWSELQLNRHIDSLIDKAAAGDKQAKREAMICANILLRRKNKAC